jgi:hypothetical protein
MAGKDGMRDLMGQHGVENPLFASLDRHRPVEHLAIVEDEARRAAGAQIRRDLRLDRTGAAPPRQRATGPLDREILTILFGCITDPAGQGLGRCVHDEIRGAIARGHHGRGMPRTAENHQHQAH